MPAYKTIEKKNIKNVLLLLIPLFMLFFCCCFNLFGAENNFFCGQKQQHPQPSSKRTPGTLNPFFLPLRRRSSISSCSHGCSEGGNIFGASKPDKKVPPKNSPVGGASLATLSLPIHKTPFMSVQDTSPWPLPKLATEALASTCLAKQFGKRLEKPLEYSSLLERVRCLVSYFYLKPPKVLVETNHKHQETS